MSSTSFGAEGSSSGRMLYIQVWYSVFYMLSLFVIISVCKTHYTVPVYTTFFLKMNPRFRNL